MTHQYAVYKKVTSSLYRKFDSKRVEKIYHSNSNQSKGVTILISSKINFIIDKLQTAKNFI